MNFTPAAVIDRTARHRPAASAGKSRRAVRSCLGGLFALSFITQAVAQTFPGGSITSGQGTVSVTNGGIAITQSTPTLITQWDKLNVGAGSAMVWTQPSATSVGVARVTGSEVSRFDGRLSANGRVFLINPNGVIFGGQSSVNVGSLVASTLNIQDDGVSADALRFAGNSGATVVVEKGGTLVANGDGAQPGTLALLGAKVENGGSLTASGGAVLMGAGSDMTVSFGGPVRLRVDGGTAAALITNDGAADVNGGVIVLSALGERNAAVAGIDQNGILNAANLTEGDGGHIELTVPGGGLLARGSTTASGAERGGTIEVQGNVLRFYRHVEANGMRGAGGTITVQSTDTITQEAESDIVADGVTGGGTVALHAPFMLLSGQAQTSASAGNGGVIDVLGSYIRLESSSSLAANGATATAPATTGGKGGTIRVKVQTLTAAGSLQASGADGGLVALEGGYVLEVAPDAFLSASGAGGARGLVKFSAKDLRVDAGGTNAIDPSRITALLNQGSDVAVASTTDLIVGAPVSVAGDGGRLSLSAARTLRIDKSISLARTDLDMTANAQDPNLQGWREAGLATLFVSDGADLSTGGTLSLRMDGDSAGTNAGDIVLKQVSAQALTVDSVRFSGGAIASDKTYDATTTALVSGVSLAGLDVQGSNLQLTGDARFADKNAGVSKAVMGTVQVSGFDPVQPTRTSAVRKRGEPVTFTGAATIRPFSLVVTGLVAASKTYDGTTVADLSGYRDNHFAGDDVQATLTGRFDTKDAGIGKTVTVVGTTLSGADAANYMLSGAGGVTTADISKRPLQITDVSARSREYDGTTTAAVSGTATSVVSGDDLRLTLAGSFDNKNAGTGKVVTVSTVTLDGRDAGNYQASASDLSARADIYKRPLTASQIVAKSRAYDGTTAIETSGRADTVVPGDDLQVTWSGRADSKEVGTRRPVLISAQLSGSDAANYVIDTSGVVAYADITQPLPPPNETTPPPSETTPPPSGTTPPPSETTTPAPDQSSGDSPPASGTPAPGEVPPRDGPGTRPPDGSAAPGTEDGKTGDFDREHPTPSDTTPPPLPVDRGRGATVLMPLPSSVWRLCADQASGACRDEPTGYTAVALPFGWLGAPSVVVSSPVRVLTVRALGVRLPESDSMWGNADVPTP